MKVTIQAGIYTYRIASRAISEDGVGCFEKRLLNELSLEDSFSAAGTTPLSLSINIRNNDWFIPAVVDLWAATVVVEADNGHKWNGKITNYDSDGEGVLYVIATEKTAPELSIQIPDEVARVVSLDENFHVSAINVTLPYVLGGNVANPILVKGILIDKTQGIYLLAVGENHQVVKVYRGTEELSSGFSAFTGTAGQENYPGICYVQITDESLRKNDDGSYVEISADIVGLKLGSHTIEECRNGARQLLWLLKTAKDGVGGWGLGISESEINLDAFAESISRVDAAVLKSDGIMYFRQEAIGYIDQICKAIRGRYRINADGKRSLFVDAPATSIKTYSPTLKNMKLLRFGKGAYTGRVYNKGRLEFGYNPLTGLFMQSVSYQNSASIAAIGEQEFLGQSYFLRDMASAQAILDYTCKKSLTGAEKVYFETLELPENASGGQIVTVDHLERCISGDYQITHMNVTDFVHVIEAERFSADDFISGTPGTAITWMKDPPIVSPAVPGVPSGLNLTSEVRPSPDGTNIVVIKGTFTPPAGSYIAASIEWGEGILPILSWNDRGMMQGNQFEIAPVKPAQAYAVRIRMVTATGKSSYITGTVTTEGDTVPPGKPAISATSSLRNVSINLSLAPVPSDMAGFQVFRNVTNDSATATQIGYVESSKGTAQTVDINTEYGSSYYYWAKAVDTWGNPSVFSDAFGPLTISMILNHDVSPEAIKQAIGSVASWSAKNCTTASIAEASGVKDVSGNAKHGRAYGGVAVVDTVMGQALQFDAIDDYVFAASTFVSFPFTLYAWVYAANISHNGAIISLSSPSTNTQNYSISVNSDKISINARNGVTLYSKSSTRTIEAGKWYHVVGIFESAVSRKLYVNSELDATDDVSVDFALPANSVFLGKMHPYSSDRLNGQIFDARIYSRALSATEVKSLYMFPGDVAFGRVTSDLVTTGQLITLSAQIAEAIINDAHINNVNAAKLTAGFINAERYEGGSITVDKLKVGRAGAALNNDPSFEDSTAWGAHPGYPSYYTSSIVTVTDGLVGNKAMRSNGYSIFADQKLIPINRAKTYCLRAVARKSSTATGTLYLALACYSANGTFLNYTYFLSGAILTTSWVERSGTYSGSVLHSSTAFVRVYALLNYGGTAGTYHEVQNFRLEEAVGTTLIEDGAITTQKMTTDAVKSLNYSTTAGSFLNLADGTFILGGSSSPKLSWNGTTFAINGTVTATAGDIAGFEIVGKTLRTRNVGATYTDLAIIYCDSSGDPGFGSTRDYSASPYKSSSVSMAHGQITYSNYNGTGTTYVYINGVDKNGVNTSTAPIIVQLLSASYYGFYTNGSVYIGNNCSALSFTDRTEMPESIEEALEIVNTMFAKGGSVDYSRLSNKAKHFTIQKADDGSEVIEEGRDLTKTVSALIMVCRKNQEEILRLKNRVTELENDEEIELLKRGK